MRTPFVAGNWKMNKTAEQARQLVAELLPGLQAVTGVERVLCPPNISIMAISAMLSGTEIGLGAQNMHWEASGAYTGEVSAQMVKEFCKYVILGHSERRAYFGETDETVNRKTAAALAAGLVPIVCVGETLSENEALKTRQVIERQMMQGLKGLNVTSGDQLVVAYEPVWAIGTGRAASAAGANEVIGGMVRAALVDIFGIAISRDVRILYGGSVTGANAAEYFGQTDIDGALVGGASLKPDFIEIVKAAAQ